MCNTINVPESGIIAVINSIHNIGCKINNHAPSCHLQVLYRVTNFPFFSSMLQLCVIITRTEISAVSIVWLP